MIGASLGLLVFKPIIGADRTGWLSSGKDRPAMPVQGLRITKIPAPDAVDKPLGATPILRYNNGASKLRL
ncbi:hypothetical protein K449DRAFT_387860 [Hypoxylon sp. EC38]|nr:hypothetical protein K449DRAFT_387860 [Hypoxylon sp. EC38]